MYSAKIMDHIHNPRNIGLLEEPNGRGEMGSVEYGDYLVITIKVNPDHIISDIRFQAKGCDAAVATSSMTTELAKGRYIYDALNISEIDIADALGGLPEEKMHCSLLGAGALRNAIYDFLGASGSGL